MPKYKHKEVSYPIEFIEYQIVTSTGVVSRIFETFTMARDYVASHKLPQGWKLIMVKVNKYEIASIRLAEAA